AREAAGESTATSRSEPTMTHTPEPHTGVAAHATRPAAGLRPGRRREQQAAENEYTQSESHRLLLRMLMRSLVIGNTAPREETRCLRGRAVAIPTTRVLVASTARKGWPRRSFHLFRASDRCAPAFAATLSTKTRGACH